MKTRRNWLVALLALALLLCACGSRTPEPTPEPEGETEMELTMQDVIDRSQLTAADFADVDFADFAAFYQLTAADLDNYDMAALLSMYKEQRSNVPIVDYTELYENAEGTLSEADLQQISQVIWELHDGTSNTAMAIDGKTQSVYYGEGALPSTFTEDLRVSDLTTADMTFVRRALEDSGITEWKSQYIGTSEGTTGLFDWSLAFRLEDGRCVAYHGEGVLQSGTPDTLRPLLEGLRNYFAD